MSSGYIAWHQHKGLINTQFNDMVISVCFVALYCFFNLTVKVAFYCQVKTPFYNVPTINAMTKDKVNHYYSVYSNGLEIVCAEFVCNSQLLWFLLGNRTILYVLFCAISLKFHIEISVWDSIFISNWCIWLQLSYDTLCR